MCACVYTHASTLPSAFPLKKQLSSLRHLSHALPRSLSKEIPCYEIDGHSNVPITRLLSFATFLPYSSTIVANDKWLLNARKIRQRWYSRTGVDRYARRLSTKFKAILLRVSLVGAVNHRSATNPRRVLAILSVNAKEICFRGKSRTRRRGNLTEERYWDR